MKDTIKKVITDLTGQKSPFDRKVENVEFAALELLKGSGIGYSQMNEMLLTLGYGRLSTNFYQFLVDGTVEYKPGAAITTLELFREGVDRFRKRAALRFGNIKYAFNYFSQLSETLLTDEMSLFEPVIEDLYSKRHDPLIPVKPIPGDETYYLGYIIKQHLDQRIKTNENDEEAKSQLEKRALVVGIGKQNHEAYLASDHMDVYVATSMRERHEYQTVNRVVSEVFKDQKLADLKLRWFDPTQAFCEERIDKGLAEGLMLKRATCTLYLAQENDTLGKDSELACTLAQGKPVIVFIPRIDDGGESEYVQEILESVKQDQPNISEHEIVLEQLRIFMPDLAWRDKEVRAWLENPKSLNLQQAKSKLGRIIREHYEKRAKTLKDTHPLGIQVQLDTGVATGVLVARTVAECSDLIWRVMTNRLEFELREERIDGSEYLLLVEKTTGSIFRVVSGDAFLTNAFWEFYLRK